jgi:hypothetical protein
MWLLVLALVLALTLALVLALTLALARLPVVLTEAAAVVCSALTTACMVTVAKKVMAVVVTVVGMVLAAAIPQRSGSFIRRPTTPTIITTITRTATTTKAGDWHRRLERPRLNYRCGLSTR